MRRVGGGSSMPVGARGVKRAYVLQNRGTESFVTHTESSFGIEPVCLIWDNKTDALKHARQLAMEYAIAKPALPKKCRTWVVLPATEDQIIKALAAGAYGPEYTHTINDQTSQFHGRTPDEVAENFREELDNQ